METRAHHVLIGLFTLLTVAAALAFALWLGKSHNERQFDLYDIIFEEAVSGLSKGSTVEFNGIKIGEVASLRLDPQNPSRVLARVRVDSASPIRTDTQARLVPAGITGLSVIRLSSGKNAASRPLKDDSPASPDENVPEILASPSPMSKLLADGEDVIFNVNELLMRARTLLSQENVRNIERTLAHIEQAAGHVSAQRETLGEALREVARTGKQTTLAMTEATRLMQSSRQLIDNEGRQTLESAQHSLASFEKATQRLDQMMADNRGQIDGGLRGLNEIGPTLIELRGVLSSLQTVSRQLEDRPADWLLGREQIKEFQP